MTRRGATTVAALLAICPVIAQASAALAADAPEGPRVTFVKFTFRPERAELLTVDPSGAQPYRLAGGGIRKRPLPGVLQAPSWSADGSLVVFAGFDRRDRKALFRSRADGSGAKAIKGARGGTYPVLSSDGSLLAFARTRLRKPPPDPDDLPKSLEREFVARTMWVVDLATGVQTRLTPWRNHLFSTPSSFTPDGSSLAFTRSDRRGTRAVSLRLSDREESPIARHASEPVYSPDGSQIALISYRDGDLLAGLDEPVPAGELYVMPTDGGPATRLTKTVGKTESSPSWDPSGERIVYAQTTRPEALPLGLTNAIEQINADGTCRRTVLDAPRRTTFALFGPAWRPGPGREAGRIVC